MKKLLILSVACFLLSCKKQEPKPVVVETPAVETPAPVEEQKINVWNSTTTGLPVGVIVAMDCANSGKENANVKDNYITIKKSDGVNEIVKDVDEDVYLNVSIGDIIQ